MHSVVLWAAEGLHAEPFLTEGEAPKIHFTPDPDDRAYVGMSIAQAQEAIAQLREAVLEATAPEGGIDDGELLTGLIREGGSTGLTPRT